MPLTAAHVGGAANAVEVTFPRSVMIGRPSNTTLAELKNQIAIIVKQLSSVHDECGCTVLKEFANLIIELSKEVPANGSD